MIRATPMVLMPDGTEREAASMVLMPDGTEREAVYEVMAPGYASVETMLDPAARPFAIAHRFLSMDGPEFTLRAATDAAARDFGALELSVAISSDGIPFGLHDQSISRVTGVPDLPAASTMTWAEISRYRVQHPRGGPSAPFMRAEELIAAYGDSHILFMDPKYQLSKLGPFWDLLATIPNATERVIVKSYGDASWFAAQATQRGYTTWGYFYEKDYLNGVLAAHGSAWSTIGMNDDASKAAWDAALAINPIVIGHISSDLAASQRALDMGASGLMLASASARPEVAHA